MENNSYTNWFGSPNSEENSNSQGSNIRPQNFITPSPQNSNVLPQNSNIRPQNIFIHPSHQTNPISAAGGTFYIYQPEMYQHPYMPVPHFGQSPPRPPGMTSKSSRGDSSKGTSIDKECGTPSSGQGSPFQPYPSPPGIDAINLDVSEDTDDGGNGSEPKGRTYGARYTSPENEMLEQSWVNVSEDSIVENDQRLDATWKRIAKDYNNIRASTRYPFRRWDILKTHFYTVQWSVSAFNGLYDQIKRDWESGQSDADILMHAMSEWVKNNKNTAFAHLGMWKILRNFPKWRAQQDRDHCGRKKAKTSTGGGYTSSSNAEDVNEERVRPIGQKAAKKKGKMNHSSMDEQIEAAQQKINQSMDEYKAINYAKLKEQQARTKLIEYEIVMKDTTGMTPRQLKLHLQLVDQIEKKWEAEANANE